MAMTHLVTKAPHCGLALQNTCKEAKSISTFKHLDIDLIYIIACFNFTPIFYM